MQSDTNCCRTLQDGGTSNGDPPYQAESSAFYRDAQFMPEDLINQLGTRPPLSRPLLRAPRCWEHVLFSRYRLRRLLSQSTKGELVLQKRSASKGTGTSRGPIDHRPMISIRRSNMALTASCWDILQEIRTRVCHDVTTFVYKTAGMTNQNSKLEPR